MPQTYRQKGLSSIFYNRLSRTKISNLPNWEYLKQQIFLPYASSTSFSNFSAPSGTAKWFGGISAYNQMIFGVPRNSQLVLELNPFNNSYSTFGSLPNSINKYAGAILSRLNGMIYCIPRSATDIGLINPYARTFTTFGSTTGGYIGGVSSIDGRYVYCIPNSASSILKIDTLNNTISTFGNISTSHAGGTLGPEGRYIYCPPATSNSPILKIDTFTDTTSTFGNTTVGSFGAVLAYNNNIYCPVNTAEDSVLKINTSSETISHISISSNVYTRFGGAIAPTKLIYFASGTVSNQRILQFNTNTESGVNFGSFTNQLTAGGRLAYNGKIYFIPSSANVFHVVSSYASDKPVRLLISDITSPFINKF